MKILQLNTVYGRGSTGKIALGIHDVCVREGHSCLTAYRYPEGAPLPDSLAASSWLDCHIHNRLARRTTLQGCFSVFHTLRLIRKIRAYGPDLIQMHNLHGSYINWALLFSYLKKCGVPVVWTFHDCSPFTGFCPYFDFAACDRWKSGCGSCPPSQRPDSRVDLTAFLFRKKRKWFCGVPGMTVVTPSRWLRDLVSESFLSNYPVRVIPNGIDLIVFRCTPSDVRSKYAIGEKPIVLGVANVWEPRKGLDVFLRIAEHCTDECRVVLVGTDADTDRLLPDSVVSIHRTQDQSELAALYSAASVFANPTVEDNFPTVNLEALACGTPVVTYQSGGSPESLDETCGIVVPKGDAAAFEDAVMRIVRTGCFTREACEARARNYDADDAFREYLALYSGLVSSERE